MEVTQIVRDPLYVVRFEYNAQLKSIHITIVSFITLYNNCSF